MVCIDKSERPRERKREREREKRERKSEGLKARDGERECRAIFGPSGCFPTHTHSRFSALLLFRMVGVKRVSFDLTWLRVLRVHLRVCVHICVLISLGFSCGCYGLLLCFEQLATAPNIPRVWRILSPFHYALCVLFGWGWPHPALDLTRSNVQTTTFTSVLYLPVFAGAFDARRLPEISRQLNSSRWRWGSFCAAQIYFYNTVIILEREKQKKSSRFSFITPLNAG